MFFEKWAARTRLSFYLSLTLTSTGTPHSRLIRAEEYQNTLFAKFTPLSPHFRPPRILYNQRSFLLFGGYLATNDAVTVRIACLYQSVYTRAPTSSRIGIGNVIDTRQVQSRNKILCLAHQHE